MTAPVVYPGQRLTARECQVVELVAEGRSNSAIGAELGLTPLTVKSHLHRIGIKVGVQDRAGILGRAVLTGQVLIPSGRTVPDGFEERHFELLVRIARGWTNAEIAAELGVTLNVAKWHIRKLLALLKVASREEAVAAGFACGVLRAVPKQRVAS